MEFECTDITDGPPVSEAQFNGRSGPAGHFGAASSSSPSSSQSPAWIWILERELHRNAGGGVKNLGVVLLVLGDVGSRNLVAMSRLWRREEAWWRRRPREGGREGGSSSEEDWSWRSVEWR